MLIEHLADVEFVRLAVMGIHVPVLRVLLLLHMNLLVLDGASQRVEQEGHRRRMLLLDGFTNRLGLDLLVFLD